MLAAYATTASYPLPRPGLITGYHSLLRRGSAGVCGASAGLVRGTERVGVDRSADGAACCVL